MIDRSLDSLYPPYAAQVRKQIADWNAFHPHQQVGICEGFRTFERQAELYAQGRTAPGAIVTNAPAGLSWHCYGLAVDEVFDADPVKPGMQWTWDGKLPWPALGKSMLSAGMDWAGVWRTFKEFPHCQNTYGMQITEALELHRQGGLPLVWSQLDEIRRKHA